MAVVYVYQEGKRREYEDCDTLDQALAMAVADVNEIRAWPLVIKIDDVPVMFWRQVPKWGADDWICRGPMAAELKAAWERACDAYFEEVGRKLEQRGREKRDGPVPF